MMKKPGGTAAAAILLAVSLVLSGCTASRLAPGGGVDARAVLADFKGRGMMDHLQALQRIADENGGNRASGTSGYEESARYVEEQLRAAGYNPVRQTFTFRGDGRNRKQVESFNILADAGGSAENTVVVGGHLDSVPEGPGINDNGSGVAAILEIARWMKESGITPVNRVRFAFWGGEEDGLYGSQHYVDELSRTEKAQTAANLNVDMMASPNGVRSIHDGDGTDFGHAGPTGSKQIEDVFFRFFQDNSLPAETTPFDGGSDYDAFLQAGIPAGGLFSGDVEKKTKAQVQSYGGAAGKKLDSCYHQACDTISNTDSNLLQEMSGALAYATASFALAPRS
ncbi:M20/M25/M40 family metallo-hydrolase [Arthrobacter sp. SO3]|uniref:M20/M25/M40 family metallo-hydrolase n=1 Tax=Arthrobacter sp. SO3 TaxID=1897057 RepID=UPI001CFF5B7F|nr:M20/M25/M40 family metallo-hydrolase [Arthrobacter sp. SO3]MCB5294014.1 Leupeptin-inactivating enzyme 1 [Arthrobacter sp. SO3]